MFPRADVPVLQLSINAEQPLSYHLALGARLHELRREGVLILGSGNIVHNLRLVDPRLAGQGTDWAQRFDDATREIMTHDPGDLARTESHRDFSLAVPTPDHFWPLAYVAGLAAAAGERATELIDGYDLGSLSMTAYQIGG